MFAFTTCHVETQVDEEASGVRAWPAVGVGSTEGYRACGGCLICQW